MKTSVIGIRREDKNEWEKRVPLIPADIRHLRDKLGISVYIQPSPIRIIPEQEYREAGAVVSENLEEADTIFAIKEIPEALIMPQKTYVFFSHTIKGQSQNMSMLRRMMNLKCNLIDYERITDASNRRLIFFGNFAGMAGMIETLNALGTKWQKRGLETPLTSIRHAYEYAGLEEARREIAAIGEEISNRGLPPDSAPVTVGFTGYGNVSGGAQQIFDLLPHKTISPQVMREMGENFSGDSRNFYKVVFKEEDLVKRNDGGFELAEYFQFPERYHSTFSQDLSYLTALINGIYWTSRYPRLLTREYLRNQAMIRSHPMLLVVGDISCDIEGSIEITVKNTKPDQPFFTYFPDRDSFVDGIDRLGITVMAVDNLPCEFPRESSTAFSHTLRPFVPAIVQADFSRAYEDISLSEEIKKALILHQGRLTPPFRYLQDHLSGRKP